MAVTGRQAAKSKHEECAMKGIENKKEAKKKPTMTLKERRAAKLAKKAAKG